MEWFYELSPIGKFFVIYAMAVIPLTFFVARFMSVGKDFEDLAEEEYLARLQAEMDRVKRDRKRRA